MKTGVEGWGFGARGWIAARGARGARRRTITRRGEARDDRGAGGGARVVAGVGAQARAGMVRARPGLDPGLDRLDWRAPGSAGRASPARGGSTGQARDRARRRRRRGAREDPPDDVDAERSSRRGHRAIEAANGGPPRSRSPSSRVSGRVTNLILHAFARGGWKTQTRWHLPENPHCEIRTYRARCPPSVDSTRIRPRFANLRTVLREAARAVRVLHALTDVRNPTEDQGNLRGNPLGWQSAGKTLKRFGAPRANVAFGMRALTSSVWKIADASVFLARVSRLVSRRAVHSRVAPPAAADHEDSHRVLLRRAPLG